MSAVSKWLKRPQATNRDALVVGVLGGLGVAVIGYAAELIVDAAGLFEFDTDLPLWITALIGAGLLAFGLVLGAASADAPNLQRRIAELEGRAAQLNAFEEYSEHLRDALGDLRRLVAGELPAFSLRDFIEGGLFVPAQRLLGRHGRSSDIRFSVLHVAGDDFVMAAEEGLFPALGHSPEGRQNFRMPIDASFSMHAYRTGRSYASGKLSEDDRFVPHPQARRPYESIVSIPLWQGGAVDGVFNVVAHEPRAFTAADRTYIRLLGSIIDVARAAVERLGQRAP